MPFEAIVILAIVVLNGVLGFIQETRAEEAVAALQRMTAGTAAVRRDGREQRIPTTEVVPGDVLLLAEGDAVSADARLVEAASLTVGEASLTGESEAVLKDVATLTGAVGIADRVNMVFKGTAVTRGRGVAVVTGTGMVTEMGNVARLLGSTQEQQTPLQREIARIGRILGLAVIFIAIVVVGAILLTADIERASDLVDVLLVGVSLAVAAVPEGLPAVLSVVLALGVQRMASRRAIVRKLSSVETLGSASVVCSDKTGTLTQNEMTVQKVVTPSGEVDVTGSGYRPVGELRVAGGPLEDGPLLDEVRAVLGAGSLANDAVLREEDGEWTIQGDPTEAAFLVAEAKVRGLHEARESRFDRVGEIPFTSERKLMTTLEADAERGGDIAVVTKGAPDVLLARCTAESRFLRFLLSSNVGEVLTMFLGVLLAGGLGLQDTGEAVAVPLLATQILWINLLTDTAPALAMGVDPPPDDVMRRRPRRITDRVIDREMWVGVLWVGLASAVLWADELKKLVGRLARKQGLRA